MSTESLAHKPSLKYNSESCAQVSSTPPTPPRPQSAMELCAKAALYWWKSGGACSALHRCCKSADVCALDARCKQPKHTRRVNSTKQTSSPGMCTSFTNFHQLRWLMTAWFPLLNAQSSAKGKKHTGHDAKHVTHWSWANTTAPHFDARLHAPNCSTLQHLSWHDGLFWVLPSSDDETQHAMQGTQQTFPIIHNALIHTIFPCIFL